ncbi:MAG: hypothetical protein JNL62_21755, partial [Bryobacterales bacterium]|nr:hypothetical protein [Bryobacterales bacterium]
FPLKGSHAAVPCDSCHKASSGAASQKTNFHFAGLDCKACHKDPHQLSKAQDCAACHAEKSWRRISEFDHSKTRFALEGAHRSATCLGCHKPQLLADAAKRPATRHIVFREAGSLCADCHEDVHGGQFTRNGEKAGCQVCHTNQSWRPPLFDHDKTTSFPLTGAHENVPCRQCHASVADVDGRQVRMYRTDSRRCEDCH